MLQSTHFDPVLGLDTHIVGIPAPPAPAPVPTPIPMPFVGMVFDPMGLVVGAAIGMATGGGPGLVLVNGIPATNCGTEVTNKLTMPHLPAPGVMFIPPPMPSNDATLFFGSLNVSLAGSFGVRLGDIALSCNDPIRLPVSTVLAIPKGPLVLNMPPMVPDLQAIAMAVAMKGIMAGLGALARRGAALFRRLRANSSFFRRLSQRLGGCHPPAGASRWRQMWSRAVRFVTGHPVDVVTGNLFSSIVDLELPGPFPLVFERVYESAGSAKAGALGFGWSHSFDESLWIERGRAVLRCGDGREIEFPLWDLPDRIMRKGDVVERLIHKMKLRCTGPDSFEVEQADGRVHELATVAGGKKGVARLVRVRSSDGHHAIEMTYDGHGRIEWLRDAGGRAVKLEHDGSGRLTAIKAPVPNGEGWLTHRRYGYSPQGDLVEVIDALGHAWRYAYVSHLLVQETNRTGFSFYFQYDSAGENARCVRTWGDGGLYDHVISYDPANRKTLVEDSNGAVTIYAYNERNQVVAVTNAFGHTTKMDYDPATGQQTLEEDPSGARIERRLDAAGNVVELIGPDGNVTRIEYEGRWPARASDGRGSRWQWRYDRHGHLLERTRPNGGRTVFSWEAGLLRSVRSPGGEQTVFAYDGQKNLVTVAEPNGGARHYSWDKLGRITKATNAGGGVARFLYDPEGRLLETSTANTVTQRSRYDAEGKLIEYQDASRHVRLGRGGYRQLLWREEAGVRIEFVYDAEERPTAVVNEKGERYRFVLDQLGRLVEEVGFDDARRAYARDACGRVIKTQLSSGRSFEHKYDVAGRLLARTNSDGTFANYTYDSGGLLVSAENESGTVELERDASGVVIAERMDGREVRSTYDARGDRIAAKTSLGSSVTIARDAVGRVNDLYLDDGHRLQGRPDVHWERDPMGLERRLRYGNGIEIEWERDAGGRPTARRTFEIGRTASAGDVARFVFGESDTPARREIHACTYEWRGEDQIATMLDSAAGPRVFAHDRRGRLVREQRDSAVVERAMDVVGNVYRSADANERRYEAGGRLQQSGGAAFEYDADGNLSRHVEPDGGVWSYCWNGHGLLSEVEGPDGVRWRFRYDAFARRIHRQRINVDGAAERETAFVWDGPAVVHELDTRDGMTTWHWQPDSVRPLARVRDGKTAFVATDHAGTPTEMYDENGGLTWRMSLNVFGEASFEKGDAEDCPWRWPGQYADPDLDLNYNFWRWYSPKRGSYCSQDPLGLDGGIHPYSYVRDPMVQIDPSGLTPLNATGYSLYHIVDNDTGEVVYVGITNDPTRRQIEHTDSGRLGEGYRMDTVESDLTYAQARGYEQADIDHFGTRDTGRIGEPFHAGEPNRCWSYDPARTDARSRAFRRHERARARAHGGC